MRAIRFRAWHGYLKRYKYMSIDSFNFGGFIGLVDDLVGNDTAIWEQYTGLKDKNGKEIYEGDILKCIEPIGLGKIRVSFYKVIFNNSSAQFQLQSLKDKYMLWSFYSGGISSDPLVVIGDIHNNADSLEVSE